MDGSIISLYYFQDKNMIMYCSSVVRVVFLYFFIMIKFFITPCILTNIEYHSADVTIFHSIAYDQLTHIVPPTKGIYCVSIIFFFFPRTHN